MPGILDRLPLAVLSAALASAAAAGAEERIAVDLVQAGAANSTGYQVTPDRHDFVMAVSLWRAPQPVEAAGPFRGLAGRCFGAPEYKRDLIVAGGGYCAYRDPSGHGVEGRGG